MKRRGRRRRSPRVTPSAASSTKRPTGPTRVPRSPGYTAFPAPPPTRGRTPRPYGRPRAVADGAIAGAWLPHDRATLGVFFYRGSELLHNERAMAAPISRADPDRAPIAAAEQARTLLRTAAGGYRATKMLDVVPVSIGMWAEAERRMGNAERAIELATEAAALLEQG